MQNFSRRDFIKFGLCGAVSLAVPKIAWSSLPNNDAGLAKKLSFYNLHTEEKLSIAFSENGKYVPSALEAINHVLRDYRTGDIHLIDPKLLDQLHDLQQLAEAPGAFHIISGYRSPQTNQLLHEHSNGVAKKSFHIQGRAIDIRLPGRDLSFLHKAALSMKAGGVGYYPGSDFIHVDTGPVRCWG